MKKILVLIFNILALSGIQSGYASTSSAVGFWKTIDDVTGKPKAIVQIWEAPNKQLFGKVLKIFPRPGHDQNAVCEACVGIQHNQRIVGMVVLGNLKKKTNSAFEWINGEILDPNNGKTYNSQIRLTEKGQKLNVRGYLGLPLFGRTQTWLRVDQREVVA